MIAIFTGLPGAGKTLKLADTAIEILYRNKKMHEKKNLPIRFVYTNLPFSDEVMEEFAVYIKHWNDPADLVEIRDADVVWDEIATHLDATQWQNMPLELKRWLQQHRKMGIEIYGTTQDFAMIDKSMRRLTSDLVHLVKIFGTRDISPTKPNPKHPFGLVMMRHLDPTIYDEAKSKFGKNGIFPSFMLINKHRVAVFDTRYLIAQGEYPALRHIHRKCLHCGFGKTVHA